jgi:hypothetical protein
LLLIRKHRRLSVDQGTCLIRDVRVFFCVGNLNGV